MRIAKRDLVLTDINLRPANRDFAELEGACRQFTTEVNNKI